MRRHPDPAMETVGEVGLRRVGAYVIDAVVIGGSVGLGIGLAAQSQGLQPDPFGPLQVLNLVFLMGYFTVLEAYAGTTIGKWLAQLVVVQRDGEACTVRGSVLRNLARLVWLIPLVILVDLALLVFDDEGRRIGDQLGDTVVARSAAMVDREAAHRGVAGGSQGGAESDG